jgi:hypothetical protein
MKRLSEGRFTGWPRSEDALASIDAKKLLLILIGPNGLPNGASGAWKKVKQKRVTRLPVSSISTTLSVDKQVYPADFTRI